VPDPGHIAATVFVVTADGEERLVGRVVGRCADLATIDALARFALVARREGGRMQLREVSAELRELLELVGLAEPLGVESCGKAELGEQLGIEEVVQADDPPA